MCDGIDNNCIDGIDDLDPNVDPATFEVFFQDTDGDGYGAALTTEACEPPLGFSQYTGDCNDGNSNIGPSAVEVCNGVDDDCEGRIDLHHTHVA